MIRKASLAVVILAAGQGTRMKTTLPKVLHPIGGKPMLFHVLDCAAALKPQKTILVLSPQGKEIGQAVSKNYKGVTLATQAKPLGTAHAVMAALPALKGHKGPVLVCYGDTPFITPETLSQLVVALQKHSVAVLGFEAQNPFGYGRLVTDAKGVLTAIVEEKEATEVQRKIRLSNSGVMGFDGAALPKLLSAIKPNNTKKEYYLTDAVAVARKAKQTATVVRAAEAEVLGVNSQAELALAEAQYQQILRRKAMEAGVRMLDPATVYLRADTRFGQDVVIHPHVVIGAGVTLGDGVEILPFCHVEKATLGKNVRIGPFARLRPGTELKDEVHIGNFVEVKNSLLHTGVKAGHLSYLGDAEIGAQANIGAGTITCNYDGYHKYKTDIGAEAFIGSNTSLVAPVKVGKGAVIGAGSTITKDVAPQALARNTMPQKNEPKGALRLKKKAEK